MPDITSLVPPKTDQPSPQQLPARGVVVAAPAALTDPTLTVVVPSHSTTYSLELRWIRQGNSLPQAGADCKVMYDETGEGIVVWWAGGDSHFAAPPRARVFNSAPITLTTGVETTLTFDSERFDNGELHSTGSNTGRLTAPTDGVYLIGCHVEFAANGTGARYATFRINGATYIGFNVQTGATAGNALPLQSLYQLAATDYVEVRAFQNSGGNLNVTQAANYTPEFWMTRLSH